MRVAVIGSGKMGSWFAKLFRDEGYSVIVASRNQRKLRELGTKLNVKTGSYLEAITGANRILICVSIPALEEVAKLISKHIKKNQILIDICSIKKYPVEILHKYFPDNLILGTHPVFGPGSTSLKDKTIILTPTNNEEKEFAKDFEDWLKSKQARVFLMSPKEHDLLMSVVLGLPHFIGLVACDVLLDQEKYLETKKVAGTTFRMLFTLAEVAALEEPELFNSLHSYLPEVIHLEDLFSKKADEWLKLLKKKDATAIAEKMNQIKAKLKKNIANYEHSYKVMYKMLESSES